MGKPLNLFWLDSHTVKTPPILTTVSAVNDVLSHPKEPEQVFCLPALIYIFSIGVRQTLQLQILITCYTTSITSPAAVK